MASGRQVKCAAGVGGDGDRIGGELVGCPLGIKIGICDNVIIRGDEIYGEHSRGVSSRAGIGPGECRADDRLVDDGGWSCPWLLPCV